MAKAERLHLLLLVGPVLRDIDAQHGPVSAFEKADGVHQRGRKRFDCLRKHQR